MILGKIQAEAEFLGWTLGQIKPGSMDYGCFKNNNNGPFLDIRPFQLCSCLMSLRNLLHSKDKGAVTAVGRKA